MTKDSGADPALAKAEPVARLGLSASIGASVMGPRVTPLATKPYRPHRRDRHELLVSLVRQGRRYREIASIYGGTPNGVRSNVRRLRERGVVA